MPCSRPNLWRSLWKPQALLLAVLLGLVIPCVMGGFAAQEKGEERAPDEAELRYYEHADPYWRGSLSDLRKLVPELKKLQPASGDAPAELLPRVGENVDAFFQNIVDLIARERINEERLTARGAVTANRQVEDSYLILRHGEATEAGDIVEYRMDAEGKRVDQLVANGGYLVTYGFALMCNYFSSAFQDESEFRYLGDERIANEDTYVIAFAQKPGKATLSVTLADQDGNSAHLLMQGIAWVDKTNFQIVRLRTDLLAPRPDAELERQTTELTLSKVQLVDVSAPLWLPKEVKVYLGIKKAGEGGHFELNYRNEHHYENYRRYRVSVRMVSPK